MSNELPYTMMLVCLNGHIIDDRLERLEDIQEEFCHKCGSKTITACPNCQASIRGIRKFPGAPSMRARIEKTDSYCYHCGQANPWNISINPKSDVFFGSAESTLNHIFGRFPRVVKELAQRYDQRSPLKISDEHDLQDFMRVVLNLFFHQVELIENHAMHNYGGLRLDISLPDQKIVLVLKMTASTLKNQQLLAHLKSDIGTYRQNQTFDTLIYYVYDPDSLLINVAGLKEEMEGFSINDLNLSIFIFSPTL